MALDIGMQTKFYGDMLSNMSVQDGGNLWCLHIHMAHRYDSQTSPVYPAS